MKTGAYTVLCFLLIAALCIIGSRHVVTLPSRPPTGNHGQGLNPGRNHCPPETITYYLDSGTFLECMRTTP